MRSVCVVLPSKNVIRKDCVKNMRRSWSDCVLVVCSRGTESPDGFGNSLVDRKSAGQQMQPSSVRAVTEVETSTNALNVTITKSVMSQRRGNG